MSPPSFAGAATAIVLYLMGSWQGVAAIKCHQGILKVNRDAESVSLGQCGKNTFKRNVDVGKPFSCKKECENGTTCRTAYVSSPSLRGVGLINCEENIFEVCTKKEVQEEFGELMCQLFIRENYDVVIHNSTKMGKKGTYCEDFLGEPDKPKYSRRARFCVCWTDYCNKEIQKDWYGWNLPEEPGQGDSLGPGQEGFMLAFVALVLGCFHGV